MTANMENKQSWTADSGRYTSLEARYTVNNTSLQNVLHYKGLTCNFIMFPGFKYQQNEVDVEIRRKINSGYTVHDVIQFKN
jgi:hypothetical protein